uniref:Uncharacterized protein n=1 Tax=Clytia hemisphaerica TaxID=252671 RepID=A0A7M5X3R3_9CNID|eukprot:TCONS_00060302-protein
MAQSRFGRSSGFRQQAYEEEIRGRLQRILEADYVAPDLYQRLQRELESMDMYVPYKILYKEHNGEVVDATILPSDVARETQSITRRFTSIQDMGYGEGVDGRWSGGPGGGGGQQRGTSLHQEDIEKVDFGNKEVHNVKGTTADVRVKAKETNYKSWIKFWKQIYERQNTISCKIEKPFSNEEKGNQHGGKISGGHMEYKIRDNFWYILPICTGHNHSKFNRVYNDRPGKVMTTTSDAKAIRIHPIPLPEN